MGIKELGPNRVLLLGITIMLASLPNTAAAMPIMMEARSDAFRAPVPREPARPDPGIRMDLKTAEKPNERVPVEPPPPSDAVVPTTPAETATVPSQPGDPWGRLADCETGAWINGGEDFVAGSARWDARDGTFQGGLQFHPQTWSAYKDSHDPAHAADASPSRQIEIAVRVQADQGWQAWPTCARLIGLLP